MNINKLNKKINDGRMNKIISIIIVNWNGKKWLKKCLDSLLIQTYPNLEIILVDNASSDKSIEFVKKNYSKIKLIACDKNHGFAKGNNIGIKSAKGEYIILLNSDVWVEKDFIEKLFIQLVEKKFDLIGPYEAEYSGKKKKPYVSLIDFFGHPVNFVNKKNKNNFFLSGVCLLFSKKMYYETGGLDEDFFMYFEEIDWFWRLNLMKKKYGRADNLFVYHAGAGSSGEVDSIKYTSFLWRNQNVLFMLFKNYKLSTLIIILPLYFLQNIIEIVFFMAIAKFKISQTYVLGWCFSMINLKKILHNRKHINAHRRVGDLYILNRMYFGSAKIIHLINFFRRKNESI